MTERLCDERSIFWDVDTQYDFMHADGQALRPGSEEIIPVLARLTDYAHPWHPDHRQRRRPRAGSSRAVRDARLEGDVSRALHAGDAGPAQDRRDHAPESAGDRAGAGGPRGAGGPGPGPRRRHPLPQALVRRLHQSQRAAGARRPGPDAHRALRRGARRVRQVRHRGTAAASPGHPAHPRHRRGARHRRRRRARRCSRTGSGAASSSPPAPRCSRHERLRPQLSARPHRRAPRGARRAQAAHVRAPLAARCRRSSPAMQPGAAGPASARGSRCSWRRRSGNRTDRGRGAQRGQAPRAGGGGGYFGEYFARIAEGCGKEVFRVEVHPGAAITAGAARRSFSKAPRWMPWRVVHSESSTGALSRHPRAGARSCARGRTSCSWWTGSRRSARCRSRWTAGASTTTAPDRRRRWRCRPASRSARRASGSWRAPKRPARCRILFLGHAKLVAIAREQSPLLDPGAVAAFSRWSASWRGSPRRAAGRRAGRGTAGMLELHGALGRGAEPGAAAGARRRPLTRHLHPACSPEPPPAGDVMSRAERGVIWSAARSTHRHGPVIRIGHMGDLEPVHLSALLDAAGASSCA